MATAKVADVFSGITSDGSGEWVHAVVSLSLENGSEVTLDVFRSENGFLNIKEREVVE